MVETSADHPGAAAETKYTHLLTLLAEHGAKLSQSQRAQHLTVARELLAEVHYSAFFVILPFTLRALSAFAASCAAQKVDTAVLDDEEPTLVALFGLVSAACSCLAAEEAYDLAGHPVSIGEEIETESPAQVDDIGGLFGAPAPPHTPPYIEGAILPSALAPDHYALSTARRSLRSASPTVQGSTAHIIALACDTATVQRAVRVRASALASLSALVRVLPSTLLAAFFPGIASKTLKLLVKVRLNQSVLAVFALDVLSVAVASVFPKRETKSVPRTETSFANLVDELRIAEASRIAPLQRRSSVRLPPKRKTPHNLTIDRDSAWYTNASRSLSPLMRSVLESADGPRLHSNPRVRHALSAFLDVVAFRDSSLQLAPVLRWQCLFSLAELAADAFPHVRDEACARLRNIAMKTMQGAEMIENGLSALVKHISLLPTAVVITGGKRPDEGAEDGKETALEAEALGKLFPADELQRWALPFEGFLRALGEQSVADILPRLNCDTLAVSLVAFQFAVWVPSAFSGPSQYELMHTRALSVCFKLGHAGLLPAVHAPLLRVADAQQVIENLRVDQLLLTSDGPRHESPAFLIHHAHAVLCLQAVTRGALTAFAEKDKEAPNPHTWSQLKRFFKDVLAYAATVILPMGEAQMGSEWGDAAPRRAKIAVLMCIAELCDLIRELQIPRLGAEFALPGLIPLLSDAAREELEIIPAAQHALEALATATGCSDARKLLRRHANFVVARLVHSLHRPGAGRLLRYIMQSGNDSVSARVVALAEQALVKQCNELAALSDERARASLAAMDAVLMAAPDRLTPPSLSGLKNDADQELRELCHMLMSFCTDDVKDDGSEAEVLHAGSHDDDDELTDDQRDARRTPFERLARSTLAGAADVLVGRPAEVRAQALQASVRGVQVLARDRRALLPAVATLLPLLPVQLSCSPGAQYSTRRGQGAVEKVNAMGKELGVIAAACTLLSVIVPTARSFVRSRFVRNIFPALRPQLVLVALHQDRDVKETETPSFAALHAADSALECTATVAQSLPDALRPFAEELLGYVGAYAIAKANVTSDGARSGNFARRANDRLRLERRIIWADMIIHGIAEVDPDRTWVGLVGERPGDKLVHWEAGYGMETLFV